MQRLVLPAIIAAFTITVNSLGRGSAVLNWVTPTQRVDGTPLANLAAYRIYYGASPEALNDVIRVDNISLTSFVVENLGVGTWYFAVSAVDCDFDFLRVHPGIRLAKLDFRHDKQVTEIVEMSL